MPSSKPYRIRCWHETTSPTRSGDCSSSCVQHCENQWCAQTLNQAKQIKHIHLAENENHIIKIVDENGIEVVVQ